MSERVYLYDTTLRDGAQKRGVEFSLQEKQVIAERLEALGIGYIEGGWPGANPTDDAFFQSPPNLKSTHFVAFGMTRKPNTTAETDESLQAVLASGAESVCLVGKSSSYHVTSALEVPLETNLKMIRDSIAHAATRCKEVLFDAEHFFDGYKANPSYALTCLKAANESGARWLVLCDTNGGTLPHEVEKIVQDVKKYLPDANLGIHCHDDAGLAVANSLMAVRAGCRMVQGTLNGLGERCGNANLVTLIPTLMLKMGFDIGLMPEQLKTLTEASHGFDALLDRTPDTSAPYVGGDAFAHKGGLHASAVLKNPDFYEHIKPEWVGNEREILVSKQAGVSNIKARLHNSGIDTNGDEHRLPDLLSELKERENNGYAYDNAAASFALLALKALNRLPSRYNLEDYKVSTELNSPPKATITLCVNGEEKTCMAEGNGPVNALDNALRKALIDCYPELKDVHLSDYHVRILNTGAATSAKTRVLLECEDKAKNAKWTTVGVSTDIISASMQALTDAYDYKLMMELGEIRVPTPILKRAVGMENRP